MKKKPCWRSHILLSRSAAFRARDRELMIKGFALDLDYELSMAKKSHWIEIVCKWRNVGCKS
jgi:hypothetical protein